jgi:hypothetical protein
MPPSNLPAKRGSSDVQKRRMDNVLMEGVTIVFRNFAGKEGQYNAEGDRNFAALIDDPQVVEDMQADGWNVKFLKAREEGDEPQAYLPIAVGYRGRPPRVVLISSNGRQDLDESTVEIADWVDIRNADLIVRPYQWAVNGNTGVKAYLKSLFITIEEDALDLKYADVPMALDSAAMPELEAGQDPNIIDAEYEEVLD